MRTLRPSTVFLLVVCFRYSLANNATTLNLDENETCKTKGNRQWKCLKQTDCPQLRGEAADVCSFQGKLPVVCCPPIRRTRSVPIRKATEYCLRSSRICEGDSAVGDPRIWEKYYSGFFPIVGPLLKYNYVPVQPRGHPYTALIGFGKGKEWFCEGSLISEQFVLSAAHCSRHSQLGPARWVRLGDLDFNSTWDEADPHDYAVVSIILHPEYRQGVGYHDIALFQLDRHVELGPWVQPACLHTGQTVPYIFATTTGWGSPDNPASTQLMEVDLKLMNPEICHEKVPKNQEAPLGVLPERMLCATNVHEDQSTCTGQPGSGLVIRPSSRCLWSLVGVSTSGNSCVPPGHPRVFTRISHYVSWIESVIWPGLGPRIG